MNVKKLFGMLLICLATGLTSCSKEDQVDISELDGVWDLVYDDPNLVVDGSVSYYFNILQSCDIRVYNVLNNQEYFFRCTYVLGAGDHLITLYEEGKEKYFKQYWIKKLSSGEMCWENASPGDGNPAEIKFRKHNMNFAL